jgi:integral membrane protein (TIGR01906 family)
MSPSAVRVAALAVGFALAGLIGLVAVFDGPDTYRDIARASGVTEAVFHAPPDLVWHIDLNGLVDLHQRTLAYVLGDVPELPRLATSSQPLFAADERAHMADVRAVFGATKVAFVAGVILVLAILRWTDRTARARLLRNAAVAAGVGVSVIAVAAAISFDQLFLLFHEIFFPQGNFLFSPGSNLLILYPDPYWYGVTLRLAITFIGAMALIAIASAATLRRARR